MKILIVTRVKKKQTHHEVLWRRLEEKYGAECKTFQRFDPAIVSEWLRSLDWRRYDRVISHLPFRHIRHMHVLLDSIENLVIFDQDTYKNFRKSHVFFGEYLRFFKSLSRFRLICSSYNIAQEYRNRGIDTRFVSKGFYSFEMRDLGFERDIPLGFIGMLKSQLHGDRRSFLQELMKTHELQLHSGVFASEYVKLLNRIQIFVSADGGFGEYMIKNFEAMACGCLLLAKRQGRGEEEALGLIDMENVALYDDLPEAVEKIDMLESQPELARAIAEKGRAHVQEHFNPKVKAEEVYDAIQEPIGENRYRSREKLGMRLSDRIRFLSVAATGRRSLDKLGRAKSMLHAID